MRMKGRPVSRHQERRSAYNAGPDRYGEYWATGRPLPIDCSCDDQGPARRRQAHGAVRPPRMAPRLALFVPHENAAHVAVHAPSTRRRIVRRLSASSGIAAVELPPRPRQPYRLPQARRREAPTARNCAHRRRLGQRRRERAFAERCSEDRRPFRFIVSPGDAAQAFGTGPPIAFSLSSGRGARGRFVPALKGRSELSAGPAWTGRSAISLTRARAASTFGPTPAQLGSWPQHPRLTPSRPARLRRPQPDPPRRAPPS